MRIWVNTVFTLTSRKTEIARSARGPTSQRPRAEDALAESYFVKKFLLIDYSRSQKFSVKVVNLETIIDMQSWCRIWPPNGSSRIRVKQKLLMKHKRSSQKILEPNKKLRVIYTLNSLEFGKAFEDLIFLGIIVRRHYTDRKQMGLLREHYAELKKKDICSVFCNEVWMKNGGQIPWNAVLLCETLKISCLMGRRPMKDVLEYHIKYQSFRLVHWLSITL